MTQQKSEILRRTLSARRQVAVPQTFTSDDIESYLIEEVDVDENGNSVLKFYPQTE